MKNVPMTIQPAHNQTNRREFLGGLAAIAAVGTMGAPPILASDVPVDAAKTLDWSAVRGFNYQPSYGRNAKELWEKFDATTIDAELGCGKRHFPKFNAVRYWLDWRSWQADPEGFPGKFGRVLDVAQRHGLEVMPVLTNVWQSGQPDYGGVYMEMMCPAAERQAKFDPYLEAVVGPHAADPRIFAWDLCNEPDILSRSDEQGKTELAWLGELYAKCKKLGAKAPLTVGTLQPYGLRHIELLEPISDLIGLHPYWFGDERAPKKPEFEKLLDDYVTFAERVHKPVLVTEACWGDMDDLRRAEKVRYSLEQFSKRKLGFMPYLLHHSLTSNAHRPEFAPLHPDGYFAFIEADGALRHGHGVFNEF